MLPTSIGQLQTCEGVSPCHNNWSATGSCNLGLRMLHVLQSLGKLLTRKTCSQSAHSTFLSHFRPDGVMLYHLHHNLNIYCLIYNAGSTWIINHSILLITREHTYTKKIIPQSFMCNWCWERGDTFYCIRNEGNVFFPERVAVPGFIIKRVL